MLKLRVIPTLLYKDLGLVKGVGFNSWRRTGSAIQAVKVYNMREVDELVFFDISASIENREPDYELVDELADECFMPMAVGGGVKTLYHIQKLLAVGADKVVINSAAIERPDFVNEAADKYGAQCVVVAIDARKNEDGGYVVCSLSATQKTDLDLVAWAKEVAQRGAGEILITSIEQDGTMEGFDADLIKLVADAVNIPVIASGGAGCYEDFVKAADLGVSAIAAASLYHFTEATPREAKLALKEAGYPVRL
ncbi:MAG: cyclase [Pseudohongiellaceae bacterium]|jgi:cyclase